MNSYVIITNNNENEVTEWIKEVSSKFKECDELIFWDNLSTDNSVAKIIETMGMLWRDEEHFKFYISSKKEPISTIKKKAFSICKGKHILIGGKKDAKNK